MVKYTSMPERTMVRPKRHWRHELLALAPVMALAVAVVVTFRKDVARLRPPVSGGDVGKATCAFVTLDGAVEAKAMEIVRSALSVNSRDVRELRADLSLSTVAEDTPMPVMDISDRRRPPRPSRIPYMEMPQPPTHAAPPIVLEAVPDVAEQGLPFPREELLKTN